MEARINQIKYAKPDVLEVELAKFIKVAREYLFEKKKTMIDFLIIGAWIMLGIAVLLRIGG